MKIRERMCGTCIYGPDSPLDLPALEAEARGRYGHYDHYRACHGDPSDTTVCRGFYDAHGDDCTPIQLFIRLQQTVAEVKA